MAWGSAGTLGASSNPQLNQAQTYHEITADLDSGNVGVAAIAVDNTTTTDTDGGDITAVASIPGGWSNVNRPTTVARIQTNATVLTELDEAQYYATLGAVGHNTGKWVFRITPSGTVSGSEITGIANINQLTLAGTVNYIGGNDDASIAYYNDGSVYISDTLQTTIATWAAGDTIDFAVDLDASPRRLWIRVNGGDWNNSSTANPATNTGGLDISLVTGALYPVGNPRLATFTLNVTPGSLPSGFSNWDDYAGESWTKAAEFTDGNAAAKAGSTVGVWFKKLSATMGTGRQIAVSFNNAANSDVSAISAWEYTVGAGATISVAAAATLADALGGNTSMASIASATEHLRFRAIARENPADTVWTQTASFTKLSEAGVGTGAAGQSIQGEWIISSTSALASDPNALTNCDNANVYVSFLETLAGAAAKMRSYRQRRV